MKRRINNQIDADKLRFIDVISSTCFRHHYAHHQEYSSEPKVGCEFVSSHPTGAHEPASSLQV
jgi:hypothetical protein